MKPTFPIASPVLPCHYLNNDTICMVSYFVSSCTTFIFFVKDSSVIKVRTLQDAQLGNQGSLPGTGKDLSPLYIVWTGCGSYSLLSIRTRRVFDQGWWIRHDVKLSAYLYLLLRLRIYGAMPPFCYIFMVWYSIKHRKHAAFTFVGHFETYVLCISFNDLHCDIMSGQCLKHSWSISC
jgi:hypothetical protein